MAQQKQPVASCSTPTNIGSISSCCHWHGYHPQQNQEQQQPQQHQRCNQQQQQWL
jgi:hypothetical protein